MMLLHFLSYPNPYIGYGVHALHLQRELAELAGRSGFQFHATNLGQGADLSSFHERIAGLASDVPVVNLLLGDGRSSHLHLDPLPGKRVTYTVFESDILPVGWKENLCRSDLVITASTWGAEILRRELGETPIAVVPEGVDTRLYHQWNRRTDAQPWRKDSREDSPLADCFRFLSVGKFEARKSFEELIAAFRLAFADQQDVRLLLRLHNVFQPDYQQRVQQLIGNDIRNRVLIVGAAKGAEHLSPEGMANLYRSSHCFVYPTKGEGWGLPLLEAISCGTPFIATHHSGPMEYLRWCRQSFSDLAYTMVEITDPEYLRYHSFPPGQPGRWAQPDVHSLALQMRNAYENWPALREQAATNARTIHRQFSWMAAAETLVDVIRSHLVDAPGRVDAPHLTAREDTEPDEVIDSGTLYALLGRRSATFRLCADHLNTLPAPRVLELGTTRSFRSGVIDTVKYQADPRQWDWGGGCGTYVIPALVPSCHLETVDPNPAALAVSKRLCRPFLGRIDFLATESTTHLAGCGGGYDLIYMDHGETGEETSELHLRDARIIVERCLLNPGGLLLIDDQGFADGRIGKGSMAIPYLLSQGFALLTGAESYQALLRCPEGDRAVAEPSTSSESDS